MWTPPLTVGVGFLVAGDFFSLCGVWGWCRDVWVGASIRRGVEIVV